MAWIPEEPRLGSGGAVVVPFEDSERPGWQLEVTIERTSTLATTQYGDPLVPGVFFETRLVEMRFIPKSPEVTTPAEGWMRKLPFKTIVNTATRLAVDFEYDEIAMQHRPPLPKGGPPRQREAGDAWYRKYRYAVDYWKAIGFGSWAEIDREVARRKGVEEGTARGWRMKARRVAEQDHETAPRAVAYCADCKGPIGPGAVAGDETGALCHLGCAACSCKRLVIDEKGKVRQL